MAIDRSAHQAGLCPRPASEPTATNKRYVDTAKSNAEYHLSFDLLDQVPHGQDRALLRSGLITQSPEQAIELLQEQLDSGEITDLEYEAAMQDLRS